MRDVRSRATFLLDLSVWVYDLFRLHGGKLLGYDLQWHHLDVSGLRRHTELWQRLKHGSCERIGKWQENGWSSSGR